MGKRVGRHSHTQAEINLLMTEYAQAYGHVARLKSGAPFVFGSRMEEIQ